jgi:hypothetical protein
MRGIRLASGWLAAVVVAGVVWCSPAAAQERIESSLRAWADIDVYSGDLVFEGAKVTALTPVLRGELELSSLQLGLDLPFAMGATSFDSDLIDNGSGFGVQLENPTLHLDYIVEHKPSRASVGVALAIPTGDGDIDGSDDSEVAAAAAASASVLGRGLWNAWWYVDGAWGLVVPASFESVGDGYEAGFDAAFAYFIPRESGADNHALLQLGPRVAAVLANLVLGARVKGVFMFDDGFGDDQAQFSLEPYAELRLPIVWLGLGFNLPLDEPAGFGDGAGMWSLRFSGGVHF